MSTRGKTSRKSSATNKEASLLSDDNSMVTMDGLQRVLDAALNTLSEKLCAGQRILEQNLGQSIEHCHNIIRELSDSVKASNETIIQQQQAIENLSSENRVLKKSVAELQVRLDDLEQYGRRNTVEVHGLPEEEGENCIKKIIDVGTALNVKIDASNIDACHRLRRAADRTSSGIIVRFVNRSVADQLMDARRTKRLSTRHLGLPTDQPIYVNQSLSPARRILFARTRAAFRENKLKAAWVDRSGRIKVRKDDGGSVIVIASEEDLRKLFK
jgi:hypothetical protein